MSSKNKNSLALFRSAEHEQIAIPPNSSITIKGMVEKHLHLTIHPRAIIHELQTVTVDMTYQVSSTDNTEESIHDILEIQLMDCLRMKQKKRYISTGETDIGHCIFVQHKINLTDEIPSKQRHSRITPAMIDEEKNIEQLAAHGIMRPSHSPWASNEVLCRRNDGKLCMRVDY